MTTSAAQTSSQAVAKPVVAAAVGQTTDVAEIKAIFEAQRANQMAVGSTTAKERKQKLQKLFDAVLAHKQEIRDALYADFRKHPSEVDLTEIYPVTGEIKHAMRHLKSWMRPQRVGTPMALIGSSSHIRYEPKGVALIISPWNFPVNLTFGPLVGAIAAGNCVVIKPSEMTPHTSAVIKKIVESIFERNEVAVVEGGIETSQAVLGLPFNHIFFTGSPAVGKIVMEAASKHLASVTLELGGKSPTIVDETADLTAAARRVVWAKYVNNGQVCISPDYVFVHESKKDEFLAKLRETVAKFYGEDAKQSVSFARIVNDRHYERVAGLVADARKSGATVVYGGGTDAEQDYVEPTILTDLDPDSDIMNEEIFGPVMPVLTYRNLDEPLRVINSKEKPLALYIYSKSKENIERILRNTRAGGTVINHSAVHFFNNNLPFGGVNNSGVGKGHGFYSFVGFSNPRGVVKQHLPMSAIELMTAPYTDFKQTLIDLSIKFF